MKMKQLVWVLTIIMAAIVITMAGCDMSGSEDSISRSERVDLFASQLANEDFDRLNGNVHPSDRDGGQNAGTVWATELGCTVNGTWTCVDVSVNKSGSPSSIVFSEEGTDYTISFTYRQQGDDYYFKTVSIGGTQFAPPTP